MMQLVSSFLVSTSNPRSSSVLVQVPLQRLSVVLSFLFPLPHTLFGLVFEDGSIQGGKSCPLKMYSDFHIN